jgi:6-pyruvoyl-tetrahydropterin synthase
MFRAATSSIAKRAVLRSGSRGAPSCATLPGQMSFHASAKRDEEAKADAAVAVEESKGGLFGTGLSEWFALPIGVAAAVPLIKLEWYVVNEETQLLAVFLAFCVTFYTQAGDAVYKALDQKAVDLLKEHNEIEDKVIQALENKLEGLKANHNMVNDFEAINAIRRETYEKLNKAGAIKPHHDLKAQVERILNMIAVEEANVTEKTKVSLMTEATASVTEKFSSDKALKKAALDAAIAKIKGGKADDPVQAAFVQFFKDKAAAVAASKDDSEEKAQRAAMIAKINSVAKSEKFMFEFDAQGQPKMVV